MISRLLATVALCILAACGPYVSHDEPPWATGCSGAPCGWEREAGQVSRTSSWHSHEWAYSFDVPGTRLTRKFDEFTGCLRFDFVAEIEPSAVLELALDYNADGSVEHRANVPASRWDRTTLVVRGPLGARNVQLYMEKKGQGRAAIAQFSLHRVPCGVVADAPAARLDEGAHCAYDDDCAQSSCRASVCARCGVGGCIEGDRCTVDAECLDGACAGGFCRACARAGSCASGAPCEAAAHCASKSCIRGATPARVMHPSYESFCGECSSDLECASGKCLSGLCVQCKVDDECPEGSECRYNDLYDATLRVCAPRRAPAQLPRGALCERDEDCLEALPCRAAEGLVKRCGTSCVTASDCGERQLCSAPGFSELLADGWPRTGDLWSDPLHRVRTCVRDPSCRDDSECSTGETCCLGTCGKFSFCSPSVLSDL